MLFRSKSVPALFQSGWALLSPLPSMDRYSICLGAAPDPFGGGTRVAGATRIACGSSHTLVLVPGAIAGWGENGSAQLGDGTQTRRLVPWLVIGY